jgi:hypothetical protein
MIWRCAHNLQLCVAAVVLYAKSGSSLYIYNPQQLYSVLSNTAAAAAAAAAALHLHSPT